MAIIEVPRVVRRVRQGLGLSQEGLSRRLNATKGAVQHWERGRNQPDLARLFLLRGLCPAGRARREVELLIRRAQDRVMVPQPEHRRSRAVKGATRRAEAAMLERENARLRQQVARLQGAIKRRSEQLRILEDLAAELQARVAELNAERMRGAGPVTDATAVSKDAVYSRS